MFMMIDGVLHYEGYKVAVLMPNLPPMLRSEMLFELENHRPVVEVERLKLDLDTMRAEVSERLEEIRSCLE